MSVQCRMINSALHLRSKRKNNKFYRAKGMFICSNCLSQTAWHSVSWLIWLNRRLREPGGRRAGTRAQCKRSPAVSCTHLYHHGIHHTAATTCITTSFPPWALDRIHPHKPRTQHSGCCKEYIQSMLTGRPLCCLVDWMKNKPKLELNWTFLTVTM